MLEYILGLPTEKRYEALINALYGQSSLYHFFNVQRAVQNRVKKKGHLQK
jgi:hypothetical protein